MTQEGRLVLLATLTVSFYGLTSFLQFNEVVFPFPLNEIIFLICSIFISKLRFKEFPLSLSIVLVTALLNLLSSEFYWSIFLNTEQMVRFSSSIATDVFKLLYQLGICCWMVNTISQNKTKKEYLISLVPISLIIIGSLLDLNLIEFLGVLFLAIYSIFQLKIKQHPSYYLWILLLILDFTKLWSLGSFSVIEKLF